jgi:hypothetical protein
MACEERLLPLKPHRIDRRSGRLLVSPCDSNYSAAVRTAVVALEMRSPVGGIAGRAVGGAGLLFTSNSSLDGPS